MVLRDKYVATLLLWFPWKSDVMKAWLLKMHMNFVLKYHIENISWRPCNCSAFQVIWCEDTIFEQMSKDRKNMSTKIKCLDKFWRNSHILDRRGSLKDALIAADNYNSTGRSVVLRIGECLFSSYSGKLYCNVAFTFKWPRLHCKEFLYG